MSRESHDCLPLAIFFLGSPSQKHPTSQRSRRATGIRRTNGKRTDRTVEMRFIGWIDHTACPKPTHSASSDVCVANTNKNDHRPMLGVISRRLSRHGSHSHHDGVTGSNASANADCRTPSSTWNDKTRTMKFYIHVYKSVGRLAKPVAGASRRDPLPRPRCGILN